MSFLVEGTPVPQGSKAAKVLYVGGRARAVLYNDNDKVLKPWRALVSKTAAAAWAGREPLAGPVVLVVEFRFVRPKSVRRTHMTVKPDKDKLERAICDALTTAGVWRDDAQVVVSRSEKKYAESAGAFVQVGVIEGKQ